MLSMSKEVVDDDKQLAEDTVKEDEGDNKSEIEDYWD